LYALIFIADDNLRTLPVGLSEFVVSDFAFWGQLMAAAALASLPWSSSTSISTSTW